jgi:hypothetical protein
VWCLASALLMGSDGISCLGFALVVGIWLAWVSRPSPFGGNLAGLRTIAWRLPCMTLHLVSADLCCYIRLYPAVHIRSITFLVCLQLSLSGILLVCTLSCDSCPLVCQRRNVKEQDVNVEQIAHKDFNSTDSQCNPAFHFSRSLPRPWSANLSGFVGCDLSCACIAQHHITWN